jgi:hypothetical protein
MRETVLIVGDQPRVDKGTTIPFDKAVSKARLESWLRELGIEEYVICNRVDADIEERARTHEGPIIALGEKASSRLKKIRPKHYRLPHPSGRNRLLNDPLFELFVLEDCRKWLGGEITEPSKYSKKVDVKAKGNLWRTK